MRKNYFNLLTFSGEMVDNIINEYLEKNGKFGNAKKEIYDPMLSRKKGKQKLRAGLVLILYLLFRKIRPSDFYQDGKISRDFCTENRILFQLMTIAELAIYSEYSVNWIFDNKGLVQDSLIRKKTAVAGKSFLEDAIYLAYRINPSFVPTVLNHSKNVTLSFTYELKMDFSNKEMLGLDWDAFLVLYSEYGSLGIGQTYTLALDLVSELLGLSAISTPFLEEIILEYGIYHEILNDLGDFSIGMQTTDKDPSDQFADIRNGVLTPVSFLMFKNSDSLDKKFIESCIGLNSLNDFQKIRLNEILISTGTLDFIKKELKKKSRELRKGFKKHFSEYRDTEGYVLFQMFLSALESNEIFHSFND